MDGFVVHLEQEFAILDEEAYYRNAYEPLK